MPVFVPRQVPSSWTNFPIFHEATSMECHGSSHLENWIISSGLYLALASCVSLRAYERISYFLRQGSLGDPRAVSHWKSGHYFYEQYGGVYGGLAVEGFFRSEMRYFSLSVTAH